MESTFTFGRRLFWLQLSGALIACDGTGAEAYGIIACVALLVAVCAAIGSGWMCYLEGYDAAIKHLEELDRMERGE